jgi:NitT/TauT family transport system substrate-binding protein
MPAPLRRLIPSSLPRRQLLQWAALAGTGCTAAPPAALRIGAHPWVGYELMYLARSRGFITPDQVRLIEVPTASASLRALAAGTLEGAGLTLDEVLSARARGLMLKVVAVLDVSHGADVLLARPPLRTLADLQGRRIGVEQNATGALMLDAALTRGGLYPADVQLVPLDFSEHDRAWRGGGVDALVTCEPIRSQLLRYGARELFSSAQVPGLIVDVLAVRADVVSHQATALRALVAGVFRAQADWQQHSAACAALMSPRLRLLPAEVTQAFSLLTLPDPAANRRWLGGSAPQLHLSAGHLEAVMRRAALLPSGANPLSVADPALALADPRFLPDG